MARLGTFYGVVGIILLLFGGVAYFFTRDVSVYVMVHVAAGLTAIATFLFSSKGSVKAFLGERSTKYGASAAVYSLLFLGILIVLNYLSAQHHHRFDLTEANVYSLSPQSENVLQQLDKKLEIDAFVQLGADPQLRQLLESYSYDSDKVTTRIIDPDQRPDLAERFEITSIPTIVLRYGKQTNLINRTSEESLTNGIIKISRPEKKTVYFVQGHGEPDIDDVQDSGGYGQLKTSLENEGYEVATIVLTPGSSVPERADLLIVAGAQRSLLTHEVQLIDAYLKGSGAGLFMLDPRATPELGTYLAQWGISVGQDIVVDTQLQLLRGRTFTLTPLAQSYGEHAITSDLGGRGSAALTTYGISRSVETTGEAVKGIELTNLVMTGPSAWAETDLKEVFEKQTVRLDDHDRKGPISLAAAAAADLAEIDETKEGTARIVTFGNANFANNQFIGQYFNRDLLLNTVGWLVGEEELISIRPRTIRSSRVELTSNQGTTVFYMSVLILPELLLIAGLAALWRRR